MKRLIFALVFLVGLFVLSGATTQAIRAQNLQRTNAADGSGALPGSCLAPP